jgi:hypothetical protein
MVTTEPAWKPQINRTAPHEGTLWQRPAVRATVRALNVVGGAILSFFAFVLVGLYAALQGCQGEETTGLCVNHAGLVPVLEWPIFVIAAIAPLAGGIAACVTRRPRWLAVGAAVAVVMAALMGLVATGQTQYELFS